MEEVSFSEPIASTSRAVHTLSYKPFTPREDQHQLTDDPRRVELYKRAWSKCHDRIQSTLSSLHDQSLDQITRFVNDTGTIDDDDEEDEVEGRRDQLSLYEVLSGKKVLKTGLILGASPGSSSLIFNSLIKQLVDSTPTSQTSQPSSSSFSSSNHTTPKKPPCLVSRFTSRDCSNVKNALRSLIAGFVGNDGDLDLDYDDDEEDDVDQPGGGGGERQQRNTTSTTTSTTLKSRLLVPEDMENLVAWYRHRFGKKGMNQNQCPTLVVLLEDLEAVEGKDLNQLIATLSHYTSTLPLILLLGIATTSTALYNLVTHESLNRLDATSFVVDPGIGAFNALIKGVFIEWQPPLSLAPRTYSDLYRSFVDVHHSIDATVSYLQYVYMNHFLRHEGALLTCCKDTSEKGTNEGDEGDEDEDEEDEDLIQVWNSLPSLVNSAPQTTTTTSSSINTISTNKTTPRQIREYLDDEFSKERGPGLEAMMLMIEFWEKSKSLSLEIVLGIVMGTNGYGGGGGGGGGIKKLIDDLCGLVLQASSTKLPQFLRHLTSKLHHYSTLHPHLSTSLLSFLDRQSTILTTILSKPRPTKTTGRTNLINVHLVGGTGLDRLPGFGEITSGARGMKGGGAAGGGGIGELDREFSKVAKDVSDGLKERLKSALKPCTEIKGYEIFFSDDISASKRLNPHHLPQILKALKGLDPLSSSARSASSERRHRRTNRKDGSYGEDDDVEMDEGDDERRRRREGTNDNDDEESKKPFALDLAIAYRTYKDLNAQGRLINLGDWWSGFELSAGDETVEPREEGEGSGGQNTNGKRARNGKNAGRNAKKRPRNGRCREDEEEDEDEESESDDDERDEGPKRRKQARFLRAVADLAHLGFVHPSTRKPEHLLKSVY